MQPALSVDNEWYPVLSHDAIALWDWVEPLIARVIEQDDVGYSTEDILTKIQMRQMQLWVAPERAAMVTQVLVYPKYKTLLVVALGGDGMADWLDDVIETLDGFAKHMGCKYVEERGRSGWERTLSKYGYRKAYVVLRKTV